MILTCDRAVAHVLGIEGGYSDNARDSGGKTRWGVTEKVARRYGYTGAMHLLPLATATAIYTEEYWTPLQLDDVNALSGPVAYELFDTGVNCGVSRAGEFLQQSLNVLNRAQVDFSDIDVDGDVGQATLRAFRSMLAFRGRAGERVLHRMLNSLQGAFYVELAETREKDEDFVFGWFAHRVTSFEEVEQWIKGGGA